ncbi:MAG: hypothetical protein ABFD07_04195 [Methanobacterium sp.]
MRKNVLLISIIFSMFIGLQIAEPASATSWKAVDHGSIKLNGGTEGIITYKWTTYQKGVNTVEMKFSFDVPKEKFKQYYQINLQKISKTKLKMTGKTYVAYYTGKHDSKSSSTKYQHTKLTAAQYYWREIRPSMLGAFKSSSGSGHATHSGSGSGYVP